MRSRGIRAVLVASASALVLAAVAIAAPVDPDDVDLEAAGGDATFNVDNENDSCPGGGDCAFTINEGSAFGSSDAFDGGLVLSVGPATFADFDGTGNLTGQELKVGPTKLAGVRVRRIERGLPDSPTLRSLVRLKNTKRRPIRRRVVLGSALGSDSDSEVVRSSNGDLGLDVRDRWAITSDEPVGGSPSDPPVTFVNYGKGDALRPIAANLGKGESDSWVFVVFRVPLAAKQTRHLLFYTELGDEHADSIARAGKFNRKRLNDALKAGISRRVQKTILNWDLVG